MSCSYMLPNMWCMPHSGVFPGIATTPTQKIKIGVARHPRPAPHTPTPPFKITLYLGSNFIFMAF